MEERRRLRNRRADNGVTCVALFLSTGRYRCDSFYLKPLLYLPLEPPTCQLALQTEPFAPSADLLPSSLFFPSSSSFPFSTSSPFLQGHDTLFGSIET